jgi:hypothetical protein
MALALTGFSLLCTMEYAAATYALATSATQGDAILKVAFSLAFGIAAFGGGIVSTAMASDDRKGVHKRRWGARLVTAVCFCVAAVNFASYVAFARGEKVAAETRHSAQYEAIKADYAETRAYARAAAGDLMEAGSAQEALDNADKVLAAGESPRAVVWFVAREDLRAGEVAVTFPDLLLAFLSGAVVIGLGSAYRMPPPARQRRKAKAKAKSVASKPKLAVVK